MKQMTLAGAKEFEKHSHAIRKADSYPPFGSRYTASYMAGALAISQTEMRGFNKMWTKNFWIVIFFSNWFEGHKCLKHFICQN